MPSLWRRIGYHVAGVLLGLPVTLVLTGVAYAIAASNVVRLTTSTDLNPYVFLALLQAPAWLGAIGGVTVYRVVAGLGWDLRMPWSWTGVIWFLTMTCWLTIVLFLRGNPTATVFGLPSGLERIAILAALLFGPGFWLSDYAHRRSIRRAESKAVSAFD
ncbi:MAG: hypothetical protein AAF409_08040 [Pseudomonadota bacterium]